MPMADQTAAEDDPFSLAIPADTFVDDDARHGDVLSDLAPDVFQPLRHAGDQFGRIEQREDAAERVVRGDTAFQP